MMDFAMWLGGIAAIGMMIVAVGSTRSMAKHLADESRRFEWEYKMKEAARTHDQRVYLETKTLPPHPWPSGRTWTDLDGVVHSVPAGFFAITICGTEIPPCKPLAEDLIDRYPYDAAGVTVATCFECLGREG